MTQLAFTDHLAVFLKSLAGRIMIAALLVLLVSLAANKIIDLGAVLHDSLHDH